MQNPVPVRWFFADSQAPVLSGPTVFVSRNWEIKEDRFDDLGEQPGPRPWDPGHRPAVLNGQRFCRSNDIYLLGQDGPISPAIPVSENGIPRCCQCVDSLQPVQLSTSTTQAQDPCGGSNSGGGSPHSTQTCFNAAGHQLSCEIQGFPPIFTLDGFPGPPWLGTWVFPATTFEIVCGSGNIGPQCYANRIPISPCSQLELVTWQAPYTSATFRWTCPWGFPVGTIVRFDVVP